MKQAQIGLVLAGAALIGWMAPGLKTEPLSGSDGEARVLDAGSQGQ